MSTDDISRRIRAAAGTTRSGPDIERIVARARRRRLARRSFSVLAVALLVGGAGLAIDLLPTRQTVRFAADGPSAAVTAPAAATPAAAPRSCDRDYALGAQVDDGDGDTVTDWPSQTEVEPVAVDGGFVLIGAGPPSTTAWFSEDGRRWARQPADGLVVDLVYDIGTTDRGEAVVLDVDGFVSVSDDAGATWTCVAMPDALDEVTEVGGSGAWWLLAAASPSGPRLYAVPRDGASDHREVDGDFALVAPRQDVDGANGLHMASGATGTVIVANADPQPVVWFVDDGLTPVRVDDAFGDALVTGLSASADGFVATVAERSDAAPQRWRSPDGVTWTQVESETPVSTCSTFVEARDTIIASGSPCTDPATWEAWRHDGRWNRVVREVDGQRTEG